MSSFNINKDPTATLDYGFNWGAWMSSGDVVSSSVWSAGGLSTTSSSISSHTTTCFVTSGGTVDSTYKVTNRVVTAQGRTEERSFRLRIIEL